MAHAVTSAPHGLTGTGGHRFGIPANIGAAKTQTEDGGGLIAGDGAGLIDGSGRAAAGEATAGDDSASATFVISTSGDAEPAVAVCSDPACEVPDKLSAVLGLAPCVTLGAGSTGDGLSILVEIMLARTPTRIAPVAVASSAI